MKTRKNNTFFTVEIREMLDYYNYFLKLRHMTFSEITEKINIRLQFKDHAV